MPIYTGVRPSGFSIDGSAITDHGRAPISLSEERIESRTRMVNGRLRANFTAGKTTLSCDWENLPSLDSKTVDGKKSAGWLLNYGEAIGATPIAVVVYYYNGATGATSSKSYTMMWSSHDYEIIYRTPQYDMVNMSIELEEI